MNSTLNKNLEYFKARFPSLFKILSDDLGESSSSEKNYFELVNARNGQISAKEGAFTLHSLYNPEREAENAVSQAEVAAKGSCIFYGFGLGWQVIKFCQKYPDKKLILIEPDTRRFFSVLEVLDWTPVFNHEKLILALGCPLENLISLLEDGSKINVGTSGLSDSFIFDIPSFTAHASDYFDGVRQLVKRNQRKNEINAATLKKFGKLWVKNSLRNLAELSKREGIKGFENKALIDGKALPFLIIGAGPSLESSLPYLGELKKRMILVCVETALKSLLKTGIEPDFIILLDPQYWAWRHIAGLKAPSSLLISEISTWPALFRFDCKKIMLCKSQFPVGQYFEEKLSLDLGDLGSGGSVASAAWNFARMCGAERIFTAGLDLSFPSKQTHIKGSSAEETFHTISDRINSVENMTAKVLFSANSSSALNYLGEKVSTDSRMKMFAWWFEARLSACPEVRTFTLCPQSMKIPGIEACKIEEALALSDITEKKEIFLKSKMQSPADTKALKALSSAFPDSEFFEKAGFLRDYF